MRERFAGGAGQTALQPQPNIVGDSVARLDGEAKVFGQAEYGVDWDFPGMLHTRLVRSTIPHGRLLSVDVSDAKSVPGVVAVVTGADLEAIPGFDPWCGPAFRDQSILAIDKVRYVGDPVAAVVATTEDAARIAADLVMVEYEELPAVFDVRDAVKPDSPIVHEVIRPAHSFADLKNLGEAKDTNICLHYKLRKGDLDKGFAESVRIFEDEYWYAPTHHAQMEPHVAVGHIERDGSVLIHSSTQSPSFVRAETARMFGLPESKVRVKVSYLGGGFGAKLYIKLEPLAAILARITGRPVRICLDRDEVFMIISNHACRVKLRTGVSEDGRLIARDCQVYYDTGAYADIGPRITQKSGATATGPYYIPNASIDSYCVYTNHVPAGAYRGFGCQQLSWAYESQMDSIASAMGWDPLEFRRKNLLVEGSEHVSGTIVDVAGFKECLDEAAAAIGWNEEPKPEERPPLPPHKKRGKGLAVGIKAVIAPTTSSAIAVMSGDGSLSLFISTVEMGQGSETIMVQMLAEELGAKVEEIKLVLPDTDVTPYDLITAGSRSTYHMGNAIRMAAAEIREQVFEIASSMLSVSPDQLESRESRVYVKGEDRSVSFLEVMHHQYGMSAGNIIGRGVFQTFAKKGHPETGQTDRMTEFWFPGAAGAEVEVDTQTGQVRVLDLACAVDAGRAINPRNVRQQIYGSAIMQLGCTLFEEMTYDYGQLTNPSFVDYKLPTFEDLPVRTQEIIVEKPRPGGPFGAIGVGESATLAVSPAIANAIEAAVGVRITDLPITPEKVLKALHEKRDTSPKGA